MIRSSKHSTKFLNIGKMDVLKSFLNEYRRVGILIIDKIWENGFQGFNPKLDELDTPMYFDYKKFDLNTTLSARVVLALSNQILGIFRSSVAKRRKCLWIIRKLKSEGKSYKKLLKKTNKNYKISKPDFSNARAELFQACADIVAVNGNFIKFLKLKSLGKFFGIIKIPISGNKIQNKWENAGILLNSFLISEDFIQLRYNIEKTGKKVGETVVGIDQGMKTVATFSNGAKTPDKDIHGHSLESIIDSMVKKRKGGKAFAKLQTLRKNFINWSLNQINFSEFKEVRLEKIWNIGYKTRRSRKMSHWTNTLIRDKIKKSAQEAEVPLIEQDSSYRSQRCSSCGSVRKANRKAKEYKCKHCGFICDADLNASLNHAVELPEIHWTLRGKKYNLGNGFYWLTTGLFTFDGQELRVPDSQEKE